MASSDTCGCLEPEVFGHTECKLAPPIPEHERVDDIIGEPAGVRINRAVASGRVARLRRVRIMRRGAR